MLKALGAAELSVKSRIEDIDFLHKNGANLEARNNYGETPLLYRIYDKSTEISKHLISLGANVAAKDNKGNGILHLATVKDTSLDFIKYLVKNGADINCQNNEGNTPLHRRLNDIEMTKFLVNSGADVDAKNNKGETPLQKVLCESYRSKKSLPFVKLLLERGANVSKTKWDNLKTEKNKDLITLITIVSKLESALSTQKQNHTAKMFQPNDSTLSLADIVDSAESLAKQNDCDAMFEAAIESLLIRKGINDFGNKGRRELLSMPKVYLMKNANVQAQALQYHYIQSKLLSTGNPQRSKHVKIAKKILKATTVLGADVKKEFRKKLKEQRHSTRKLDKPSSSNNLHLFTRY